MATKSYTAEFYVISEDGKRNGTIFEDLLKASEAVGYTPALSLTPGEDEKHQFRSLTSISGGRAWSGIFGRCRFNETLEQGTEDGLEEDDDEREAEEHEEERDEKEWDEWKE